MTATQFLILAAMIYIAPHIRPAFAVAVAVMFTIAAVALRFN